ncbi:hypothetical protein FHT82_001884 [Rhizobium sp. BK275]|uniref:hypothetical protein n=1 Tax=unclassified Rhizobium TaxID=2613769 RepID=UPI001622461B|nr:MULTISPECIES: hypothetical protein [unclassified Rhizobium]MBB3389161.1 hypothetical protein [Rhizobium sp. BK275]MBB3408515.1 hypothetical protein [Rhizobium sp. BK316]
MNDNDEMVTVLKCDVELNFTGPIPALVNKRAAAVLRSLAERLEKDEFEDGFHPVKDENGEEVGEIYVDYSGMM